MGKETHLCCLSLGKKPQTLPAALDLQSCVLLELPLGRGLWCYSSWGLCPAVHHHHCWGLGCCSEQSCWPFLHELQHKLLCLLATSVNCTCSCLYSKNVHVGPNWKTLPHRTVGKRTTNTITISTFCSKYLSLLSTQCFLECQHTENATEQLATRQQQRCHLPRSTVEEFCPASQGDRTDCNKPQEKATDQQVDRRTKPEMAGKLYGCITVERCDGQPVPKSDYTPASKRGQGKTLAHRHPTPHRRWASEVEPLPVGLEPLRRAWHWLAGASVAVPPGFTTLTHLTGSGHRSPLIVTVCTYASRSIPDTAYTSPLHKLSTAVPCWLFFPSCTILPFHFLGYPTHLCSPLMHSQRTGREQNCYFQQILKDWRAFRPFKVYVA